MKSWLGSLVFVVFGTIALASGCGSPSVINSEDTPEAGAGTGNSAGNGAGATAGSIINVGDGGDKGSGQCSTCAELNANCGAVSDPRCDTVIQCGKCTRAGEFCGGDGPSRCGDGSSNGDAGSCSGNCMSCTPKTCKDLGYTCGLQGDDCGGMLDCGDTTCTVPGWTCGGGKKEGQCGCTGACASIPDCSKKPKKTTTLTGKVYDPAGNNPLYHVFVYVANNPKDPDLKEFPAGITCDVCGATAAGDPLLSEGDQAGTYTDVDGSFELKNVPVGDGVTVVIQLGRWRRVFEWDITTPCDENKVPDKTFLMPSKKSEGDIPLMAMVTGDADSLECVLRKMGIDGSEFTNPADGGRVHFYKGSNNVGSTAEYGQVIDADTPMQAKLFASVNGQPVINDYDMTILACQGYAPPQTPADLATLRNYAATGGRVFSTHYNYSWIKGNNENAAQAGKADNWNEVATWHVDENDRAATGTGTIDLVSNPKGSAFQGWLEAVNASTGGLVTVKDIRHDVDAISSVDGQTQQWLYRDGSNRKTCSKTASACTSDATCSPKVCSLKTSQTCTVNSDCSPGGVKVCRNNLNQTCTTNAQCTGANNACVLQTCDSNVCQGSDYSNKKLPLHFTFNTPVNTVQDLSTKPPTLQCGRVLFSDFHVQNADHEHDKVFPAQCGKACTTNTQCTSVGKCVSGYCLEPMNAQEKLLEFMIFDLGSCVPPPKPCVPANNCPANADCGYAPDGCGGLVSCGKCPTGESCGVGNPPVPNKCGKGTQMCVPETCGTLSKECGPAADGCGEKIDSCGTCNSGQLCEQGECISIN